MVTKFVLILSLASCGAQYKKTYDSLNECQATAQYLESQAKPFGIKFNWKCEKK